LSERQNSIRASPRRWSPGVPLEPGGPDAPQHQGGEEGLKGQSCSTAVQCFHEESRRPRAEARQPRYGRRSPGAPGRRQSSPRAWAPEASKELAQPNLCGRQKDLTRPALGWLSREKGTLSLDRTTTSWLDGIRPQPVSGEPTHAEGDPQHGARQCRAKLRGNGLLAMDPFHWTSCCSPIQRPQGPGASPKPAEEYTLRT